jgi:hypothetical protein
MSLHYDTTTARKDVIRLNAGGFSLALRQMFAPLVHQISARHHARKIADARRATQREISGLPASLQQDLAFSDGTVIAR